MHILLTLTLKIFKFSELQFFSHGQRINRKTRPWPPQNIIQQKPPAAAVLINPKLNPNTQEAVLVDVRYFNAPHRI